MRNRLAFALVLAAAGMAAAQQPTRLEPQATGTGAIVGRVVEAGSDRPVASARLWLHQTRGETPAGVSPRSEQIITDSSGAFAFRNLPAGQFGIEASADGYQPGAIGKRRPEGEQVGITLKDGQTFSNATIELFRSGTIGGVVTNERGEPMKEVQVETWWRRTDGQLEHRLGAATDAAGVYRMTTVPPGDHYVVARISHHTLRQGPAMAQPSPCAPPPPPAPPGVPSRPVVVEKPKICRGRMVHQTASLDS
jgi:hypothetical protein